MKDLQSTPSCSKSSDHGYVRRLELEDDWIELTQQPYDVPEAEMEETVVQTTSLESDDSLLEDTPSGRLLNTSLTERRQNQGQKRERAPTVAQRSEAAKKMAQQFTNSEEEKIGVLRDISNALWLLAEESAKQTTLLNLLLEKK
ncbi:uncharacterized protein LOC129218768 [Uloborus diversus]|uniref:uncharacterized protein LOC129218768 n=1 Tax=Uloborus diversus TaxID=327109 RepID=UPI002409C450|nr:uncharacterized protein LOC129218768 [Uloborus diversus]